MNTKGSNIQNNASGKVKFLEKIGYASGDFANTLIFETVGVFLTIFYTDVFGLSPLAVTVLFFVARVWDAINDPIMGVIVDKTDTKHGKFRPWLLWGAVPFAVVSIVCFTTPDFSYTGKLVYAYVTYICLGMIYTMINTPYGALASALTQDPKEQGVLALYRIIGSRTGAMVVSTGIPLIVSYFSSQGAAKGYQIAMIIFGILGACLLIVCFKLTKEKYASQGKTKFTKKSITEGILRSKPVLILGMVFLLIHTNLMLTGSAATYLFKYNFNAETSVSIFNFVGSIGMIVSMIVLSKFIDMWGWDKKKVLVVGTIGLCIMPVYFMFCPYNEVGMYGAYIARGIQGIFWGCSLGLIWGFVPDLVKYNDLKLGLRMEGVIFASMGLAFKIGLTIAGVLPGILLEAYGYVANVEQTAHALEGIKMLNTGIPLVVAVLTVFFAVIYPLNDKRSYEILEELNRKKGISE